MRLVPYSKWQSVTAELFGFTVAFSVAEVCLIVEADPVTAVGAVGGGLTNTHAAPDSMLSLGPPIIAVDASADSAMLLPKRPLPFSPAPVSFAPCCSQVLPDRVN